MPTALKENDRPSLSPWRLVLLVRHGEREMPYSVPRPEHHLIGWNKERLFVGRYRFADKQAKGKEKAISLSGWLAETLELYESPQVSVCYSSNNLHAWETADAYLNTLRLRRLSVVEEIKKDSCLDPDVFWHDAKAHSDIVKKARDIPLGKIFMIVGHQPQLTWIANDLLYKWSFLRWILRKPLPLGQSEIACISLDPKPLLLWAITEPQPATLESLINKIKSKVNVLTYFASFITVCLSAILLSISTSTINPYSGLGTLFIMLSLGLCVSALCAYDRLMMPSLFWGGRAFSTGKKPSRFRLKLWTPRRPPTQQHWVLHLIMVRIWKYLFIPAIWSCFIGIALMVLSSFATTIELKFEWYCLVLLGLVLLVPYLLFEWVGPSLGFDD